jgi:hypothetical protein
MALWIIPPIIENWVETPTGLITRTETAKTKPRNIALYNQPREFTFISISASFVIA